MKLLILITAICLSGCVWYHENPGQKESYDKHVRSYVNKIELGDEADCATKQGQNVSLVQDMTYRSHKKTKLIQRLRKGKRMEQEREDTRKVIKENGVTYYQLSKPLRLNTSTQEMTDQLDKGNIKWVIREVPDDIKVTQKIVFRANSESC